MKKFLSSPWLWLAIMMVAMVAAPAWGQAPPPSGLDPLELADDDMTKTVIFDQLFGPLLGVDNGNPLGPAILMFNSMMLFVGGILLAYTLIAGTMSTAHDGQMLGKKWSAMWLPLRTVLGAVAVAPVLGGGFCLAQAAVLWLAMQGVSLANQMWSAFVTDPMEGAFYAPPSQQRAIRSFYETMLIAEVCTEAYRKVNGDTPEPAIVSITAALPNGNGYRMPFTPPAEGAPQVIGFTYGNGSTINLDTSFSADSIEASSGTIVTGAMIGIAAGPGGIIAGGLGGLIGHRTVDMFQPVCGSITLNRTVRKATDADPGVISGDGALRAPTYASELVDVQSIYNSLLPVHIQGVMDGANALNSLARQIVDGEHDVKAMNAAIGTVLAQLTAKYGDSLTVRAREEYERTRGNNPAFVEKMQQDGWLTAGAFYMKIVQAQDQISRAVSQIPGGTRPIRAIEKPAEVEMHIERVRMALAMNTGASGVETMGDNNGSESEIFKSMMAGFVTDDYFANIKGADIHANPVIMAKNLGDNLIFTSISAFIGGLIAVGASSVTVVGTGVTGIATLLAPMLMTLFSLLFIPGAILAYVVPMMPYILWLGVVLGWVILLVEAMIAAPLWAIVHMAPDGDGIVGRGGQGYMLVLSLMLRPALMIFGLICAIVVMKPIGFLVNTTFSGAFNLSVTPGAFNVLAMMAGCLMYAMLMYNIITRVFSLIHVVPDRLLRWIGGGGNELGQEAQALEGKSLAHTVQAMGAMKMSGQMAQDAGRTVAQLNAQHASTMAQKSGNVEAQLANTARQSSEARREALAAGGADNQLNDNASKAAESAGNAELRAAAHLGASQGGILGGGMLTQGGRDSKAINEAIKSGRAKEFTANAMQQLEKKEQEAAASGRTYTPTPAEQHMRSAWNHYKQSVNPLSAAQPNVLQEGGSPLPSNFAETMHNQAQELQQQSAQQAAQAAQSSGPEAAQAESFSKGMAEARSNSETGIDSAQGVSQFMASQAARADSLERNNQPVPDYLDSARRAYHAERASKSTALASEQHGSANVAAGDAFTALALSNGAGRKEGVGQQVAWNRISTPEGRMRFIDSQLAKAESDKAAGGNNYPDSYIENLKEAREHTAAGQSTYNGALDSIREVRRAAQAEAKVNSSDSSDYSGPDPGIV